MSQTKNIFRLAERYSGFLGSYASAKKTMRGVVPDKLNRPKYRVMQTAGRTEPIRYEIKDRSPSSVYSRSIGKIIRDSLKENAYSHKTVEVKKCFENMENVQKHWYLLKRKHYLAFETEYDPNNPNLWQKVQALNNSKKRFVQ